MREQSKKPSSIQQVKLNPSRYLAVEEEELEFDSQPRPIPIQIL